MIVHIRQLPVHAVTKPPNVHIAFLGVPVGMLLMLSFKLIERRIQGWHHRDGIGQFC